MDESFLQEPVENLPSSRKKFWLWLPALILFFAILFFTTSAPSDFPEGRIVNVPSGSSLRGVSLKLKESNIIRSRTAFEAFAVMHGGDRKVIASDYFFSEKLPAYEVARRISKGEHGMVAFKITIPEGLNNLEISDILFAKLPYFNKENFLSQASGKQGYLFPDTYFFFPTYKEEDVIKLMEDNFEKKLSPLRETIRSLKKTEEDIVIMASLIEKEAKGDADREIISGILWKRLSIGIPLQADAAPETYKEKGLPENPIANPGLKAMSAAMYPESSPYLYYLHDKEGMARYAKNFEEHRRNIEKYLK